jgi:Escherichia/Staphylococcus phage prohead protease
VSPDLEHRSVVELRAERQRIVGYAVVFDVRSRDLGGFVEVVKPQAVASSLASDVVALFNHDSNQVLGRTPQTLQLETDTRGLHFTLDPAPTQAGRDAFELVKRGDITGASFGFRTKQDAWRKDADVMIRELLAIELAEISLTAFPAYQQTDVSIAQRSLQTSQRQAVAMKPLHWLQLQARVR